MNSNPEKEKYTRTFDNGQTKEEGWTINDKYHGSYTAYYYETEEKRIEGNYISGKKDGEWKKYYPGGQIKEKKLFGLTIQDFFVHILADRIYYKISTNKYLKQFLNKCV